MPEHYLGTDYEAVVYINGVAYIIPKYTCTCDSLNLLVGFSVTDNDTVVWPATDCPYCNAARQEDDKERRQRRFLDAQEYVNAQQEYKALLRRADTWYGSDSYDSSQLSSTRADHVHGISAPPAATTVPPPRTPCACARRMF